MSRVFLVIVLMLVVSLAFGSTVDGVWEGSVPGRDGTPTPIKYTFKAEGSILTGTVDAGGQVLPVLKGKIDGNNISFAVDVDIEGQLMTVNYTGIVSTDKITLSAEIGEQIMEIVVVKAK